MAEYNLFMVLLGCKPPGRHIEQHDIFFGIAKSLSDLKADMQAFWPDSVGLTWMPERASLRWTVFGSTSPGKQPMKARKLESP